MVEAAAGFQFASLPSPALAVLRRQNGCGRSRIAMQATDQSGEITGPIFIAGATGRTGKRVAKLLSERGVPTRLGVRDPRSKAAQSLESEGSNTSLLKYNASDSVEDIQGLIGDSTGVVCALGAARSPQGPPTVDYKAVVNLARAARGLNRDIHFVLVSSIGVGGLKFPAVLLNLAFGVLIWKGFAEDALRSSRMSYTILRPGGMESPKDDFKETHNLVMKPAGTYGNGLVSRLQIAEVAVEALANPGASKSKTLEIVAETDAPERPIAELLAEVPVDSQ